MPTHPTKVVVTGVPPGPAAQAIIDRYQAPLRRFHSAQQQNVRLAQEGGSRVHRSQQNWGDAVATYSNVFGQETMTLTVHPSVVEEVTRQPTGEYWKFTLVEMVVPDMIGFDVGFDLILKQQSQRQVIMFAGRQPDDEHPNDPPSPEVSDPDRTVSFVVDMTDFGGQVVEIEVRGVLYSRRIKGGDGHFQDEEGVVVASTKYGARGISNGSDGDNIDGDPFGPGALSGAPNLSTLDPAVVIPEHAEDTPPEDEARTLARLQASFDEWAGVTDYTVSVTDHRQSIIWLAHWNFGPPFTQDLPTRWSFLNPHSNSTIATGGVNPNDYNVFPYLGADVTVYWDDDHHFTKTVTTLKYTTPFGQFWPIPATGGVQSYEGDYFRGTDYYVPTWKYTPDRSVTITAVSMHHNPWTRTSHRFMEGDEIPGETDPPTNDCYRWETTSFPERVSMEPVTDGLVLATGDSITAPSVLMGTLKIDTNSGKVTFKLGQGA